MYDTSTRAVCRSADGHPHDDMSAVMLRHELRHNLTLTGQRDTIVKASKQALMAWQASEAAKVQQSPCLPGPPTGGRGRSLVATACTRPIFYVNLAAVMSEIPGLGRGHAPTIPNQVWRMRARTKKTCQLEPLDGITMRQSIRSCRGGEDPMAPSASAGAGGVILSGKEETAEQTAGLKKIEGEHGYCTHRAACSELRLAPWSGFKHSSHGMTLA